MIYIFFVYSWIIRKIAKNKKIKIIHLNDYKSGGFLPFLKIFTKSKIVWHIRDLFPLESKLKYFYYKIFGKFSDILIANSPLVERMLHNMGFKKVKMIYNIMNFKEITLSKIEARKKLNLPCEKIIIGYIGRISEEKELEKLLEAINLIKYKNVLCLIVGEDFKGGFLKEKLLKYAKERGIEDYVKFTGWKENTEDYYVALDIFVHPRENTYEPFGRNVVEAMFYEIPVCVSKKFSWLIKDKENGFIFEGGAEGIAKRIVEIFEKENREIVSKNAKKFVEKEFKNEKIVNDFIKILFNEK
ncbi:MAG: glycosyltransferase family 4 protein [candidate division WOR-3 bacterium]